MVTSHGCFLILLSRAPQIQGSLDGLCGLYAIVNALMLLGGRHIDPKDLFAELVKSVEGRMGKIILSGMTRVTLRQVLRRADRYLQSNHGCRLHVDRPMSLAKLDAYWSAVSRHQVDAGLGSVILGVGGRQVHWTCLKKITPRSIHFHDSSPNSFLQITRRRITLHKATVSRPYSLMPEETFLLRLS